MIDLTDDEVVGFRPAEDHGFRRTFGTRGPHGVLQRDLARYLQEAGYLTFTEIQITDRVRCDVVALKPSYSRLDIRCYEVKANRRDLLSGLNNPAWSEYREYFHRVIFAFPAGLAKQDEIPPECGIITNNENGWHHVRPGRSRGMPPKLDAFTVLALLFRGYEEHRQARDIRLRLAARPEIREAQERAAREARQAGQGPEMEEALKAFRDTIYEVFGITVKSEWAIESLTRRLQRVKEVLEEFEGNMQALGVIGHYLAAFPQRHSRLADLRDQVMKEIEGEPA